MAIPLEAHQAPPPNPPASLGNKQEIFRRGTWGLGWGGPSLLQVPNFHTKALQPARNSAPGPATSPEPV